MEPVSQLMNSASSRKTASSNTLRPVHYTLGLMALLRESYRQRRTYELKHSAQDRSLVQQAALNLRNMSRDGDLGSSAQCLYGRMRTAVPTEDELLRPKITVSVPKKILTVRMRQKEYAKIARPAPTVSVGDRVRVRTTAKVDPSHGVGQT